MKIKMARLFGIIIGALGLVGLFVSGHLFDLMNVDFALDVLRIIIAGALLYAAVAKRDERLSGNLLLGVGVLYILMGLFALADLTLGGLAPAGLTGFDIAFHLLTGAVAAGVGATNERRVTMLS